MLGIKTHLVAVGTAEWKLEAGLPCWVGRVQTWRAEQAGSTADRTRPQLDSATNTTNILLTTNSLLEDYSIYIRAFVFVGI